MRYGYCERIDGAFWSEPFNAVTNAAFLVAGFAALWLWRRHGRDDIAVLGLIMLVLAIGFGSFLFHTVPNRWTLAADVVPIQLFAFGYFALALRRFLGASRSVTAAGTLAFLGFALALSWAGRIALPPMVAGSAGYAAFLLGILGIAAALPHRPEMDRARRLVWFAGLVFAVSLTLRSTDGTLCGALPVGTHWLWHLLNALVLYSLLRAALPHGEPASVETGSTSRGR